MNPSGPSFDEPEEMAEVMSQKAIGELKDVLKNVATPKAELISLRNAVDYYREQFYRYRRKYQHLRRALDRLIEADEESICQE